jgi:L-ribulose-5-phosphate 3-epimerase
MRLGIYEKALADDLTWSARFSAAAKLGFDFLEMSLDATPDKLARLAWGKAERRAIAEASREAGVLIHAMVLSAHRAFPIGSADRALAAHGQTIMTDAITLASDLGIRIVQVAGYFSLPGEQVEGSRERFLVALERSVAHASELGVMLAIENVDGRDVTSVADAMALTEHLRSPWLSVYADVGNSAANGHGLDDLKSAEGNLAGVHLKDSRPGEFRRVRFDEGVVNFPGVFKTLEEMKYRGPLVIEMWSDNRPEWRRDVEEAKRWIVETAAKRNQIPRATNA